MSATVPIRHRVDWLLSEFGRALPWLLPAVGSLLAIGLAWPFLWGAQSRAWDDLFHQAQLKLVAEALADGRNPFGLLPTHFGLAGLRFYQGLHYLVGGTVHALTGIPVTLVHNWMLALLFAASPWAYRRLLLEVGLSPHAAGAAAMLTVGSIAGLGNSFEAYYELGVITQAPGAVLLPLALAGLVRLCREGKGVLGTAVLLALTVLAHAMFAVYVALAALLAFFVLAAWNRAVVLRLAVTGALALALTLGWLLPFLDTQARYKPIPDIVARADRVIWFAGYSPSEMDTALFSGRVFDGGHRDGSAADKRDTRMNMTGTRQTRLPWLSLLVLAGVGVALLRWRDPANRFLLAGLALGILLMLGPDDQTVLYHIPVMDKVQAFRVPYFIELFAFGLAGLALAEAAGAIRRLARGRVPQLATRVGMSAAGLVLVGLFCWSTTSVASPLLDEWNPERFERYARLLRSVGPPDPQKRVLVKFRRPSRQFRYALEHGLEVYGGFRSSCNHWTGLSSTINLRICGSIFHFERRAALARLLGLRYFIAETKRVQPLLEPGPSAAADYRELGRVRRLSVIEDRKAAMLHAVIGPRVLVVTNAAQWTWLTEDWLRRFSARIGDPATPWLLRAPAAALDDTALLDAVDAVMVLDPDADVPAETLNAVVARKTLLLGRTVEGVSAPVLRPGGGHWNRLLGLSPREVPPAALTRLDGVDDPEHLQYRVQARESSLLLLSMQGFRNWTVRIDGRRAPTLTAGPDEVAALVPAGTHELDFRWEFTGLETWTMAVSALSWLGLLGWFGVRRGPGLLRRLRRGKSTPSPRGD